MGGLASACMWHILLRMQLSLWCYAHVVYTVALCFILLLHPRSQKHQLLHLPPRLRLPQHLRLKRYVGLAVVGGASGGVVMRFVCYKYVKHGVCVWCNACMLLLNFVMNGEFLVCDAYAHNSTLYMVVRACGTNICGVECVSVATCLCFVYM